jgi:hypothetical protein
MPNANGPMLRRTAARIRWPAAVLFIIFGALRGRLVFEQQLFWGLADGAGDLN